MNWLTPVIQKEISEEDKVLDLGCGKGAVTDGLKCKRLVGVDIFEPWLKEYKGEKILGDVTKIDFPEKSFDVVLALDLLEHLDIKEAEKLIEKMKKIARKKVVCYTTRGFKENPDLGNPYNVHKCGFSVEFFKERGFEVIVLGDMLLVKHEI